MGACGGGPVDGTEGATQNRPEDTFDGGVNMDSKIRDEPSPKEEVLFSFDAREKIFELADDFGSRAGPDRPAGRARETPAPMTSQSRLAGNRQPAEGKLPANGDGGYYDLPLPWSGGYQSAYPHYQPQGSYPYARGYEGSNGSRREPGTPTQDMSIADRMSNMENMMGKMAGVYQATMERFAHLAIENNSLLSNHQNGFRKKYSTRKALVELNDIIFENMNNGNVTAAVFIDLRKAFDTVDHSILLRQLDKMGIKNDIYKWCKDYLFNREQKTLVNGINSNYLDVSCGVPQGSVLGPLFFLIYVNDIVNRIGIDNIKLYADDTVIFVEGNDMYTAYAGLEIPVDSAVALRT